MSEKSSKFRVCIAGGRDFNDQSRLFELCDKILVNKHPDIVIVTGAAWGADAAGIEYAKARGYEIDSFPVLPDQWRIGRWMGHRRNEVMLKSCDALISFWDQKSKGTGAGLTYARNIGLLVREQHYVGDGQRHLRPDPYYRSERFRRNYLQ
jgi:hypothetical protein